MFIVVKNNKIIAVEDQQFDTVEDFGEWIDIGNVETRPNIGYEYVNGAIVYPTIDIWDSVRAHRDYLLKDCDWVTLRAYSRNEPVPAEWSTYQQALRDITTTYSSPDEVIWPTKPE